jgi:pilus assembly protein Flp/PilA
VDLHVRRKRNMTKLAARLRDLRKSDEGATMVEYGIMVALIAVIVMVAVGPLGQAISTMFQNITGSI